MAFLLIMALAYLTAFVPLVAAFVLKARKVGSFVATVASLSVDIGVSAFFFGMFGVGQANTAIPVIAGILIGLLCLIAGAFLYFTSDAHN